MADAITNTTTTATLLPTLVGTRVNYYYEKIRVFDGLIGDDYHFLVPNTAKSFVYSQSDYLTMGALGGGTEGVTTDSEAFTTTGRTFTPALLGTNIVESWQAANDTPANLVEIYAEAAATAYASLVDDAATYSFAAQYGEAPSSTPDHEIGTSGTALTASLCRQGAALLMAAGTKRPYHWVIDPAQFEELMRDAEAKQYLMATRGGTLGQSATAGVAEDRFLGQIYGVYVWVGNAMISSSGVHSIMFGRGAFGQAYKMVSTPANPTPARVHMSSTWEEALSANRIFFRACIHNIGAAWTSTTNKFCVDIIS